MYQAPTVHRCCTGVIMPPDSCHSSCEVSNIISIWWMGILRIRGPGCHMPTTVGVVSSGHNRPGPPGSEGSGYRKLGGESHCAEGGLRGPVISGRRTQQPEMTQ